MKTNFCVIMAGGIGSRFWPMSRADFPKQFIDILGTGKSLIQQTYDRFKSIVPAENFLIVTNSNYKDLVLKQLPEIKDHQVLLEPFRRNTAPCIEYANQIIQKKNPNANIIVTPADHLVMDAEEFRRVINKGLDFISDKDALLTLGINPSRPDTGYGYIQKDIEQSQSSKEDLFKVKTFTEKPDLEMAKFFLDSGEFSWNSGIFIWSLNSIQKAFSKFLPDLHQLFEEQESAYCTEKETQAINKIYSECENISIDYGIMEKSKNVFVLAADFGWSDLGTWGSLYANSNKDDSGNVIDGKNTFLFDSKDSIVKIPSDKLVIAQGLEGFIVVESNDTLLICKKENEQNIKRYLEDVKENITGDSSKLS